jgi:type I restriction enzyme S subunit
MSETYNWTFTNLRSVAISTAHGFIDGDWIEAPYITSEGIRLIQTGNVGRAVFLDKGDSSKYISKSTFRLLRCKAVNPGDILICRLADPIGRACEVPADMGDAITSVDCTIVRVDPARFDKRFVLHWLNSDENLKNALDVAAGSTRSRISRSNLGNLPTPKPDLDEQRFISRVLDSLDMAIQETEAIIAKLTAVKQGLLHDLLTRGIDANGELRPPHAEAPHLYKQSPLGWIPTEWESYLFGDVIEHIIDFRGRTPKKLGMDWGGGDILALSANNVQQGGIDISREAYFGSERLYRKWMTSGDVRKGDVLLTMEAPLGNVAQITDDAKYILSQRVIAFRFNASTVLNDFAFWQIQGDEFQHAMVRRSTGSTATGIQRAELVKLHFRVPSSGEQSLIAQRLSSIEDRLRSELHALEKLRNQKSGLMDDLLTGRVRVTPLLEGTPA